ncbi:MAG: hypothetical protein AAF483_20805 [Planctomycetota bacterium]
MVDVTALGDGTISRVDLAYGNTAKGYNGISTTTFTSLTSNTANNFILNRDFGGANTWDCRPRIVYSSTCLSR